MGSRCFQLGVPDYVKMLPVYFHGVLLMLWSHHMKVLFKMLIQKIHG